MVKEPQLIPPGMKKPKPPPAPPGKFEIIDPLEGEFDAARANIRETLEDLAFNSEAIMKDQAAAIITDRLATKGLLKGPPVTIVEQQKVGQMLGVREGDDG